MKKINKTPLAAAMGAALISSVATVANADSNPFAVSELSSGYMQLAEMKCGASMGMPEMKKGAEGACAGKTSATTATTTKAKEGSCGTACQEGMKNCAAAKNKEGACGANKKGCGEEMAGCAEMQKGKDGSCGANMKK